MDTRAEAQEGPEFAEQDLEPACISLPRVASFNLVAKQFPIPSSVAGRRGASSMDEVRAEDRSPEMPGAFVPKTASTS